MVSDRIDPVVARVLRATVRVGSGTGVLVRSGGAALIATANHVVRRGDSHRVKQGLRSWNDCPVIDRAADVDLALVTPPRDLEGSELWVADEEGEGLAGDQVLATGFPDGWKGDDPVVGRGTVAGTGEQNWVNIDGSWGHSGGPVCVVRDGVPLVTGILLGPAGEVNRRLKAHQGVTEAHRSRSEAFRQVTEKLEEMHGARLHDLRLHLSTMDLIPAAMRVVLSLVQDHFRTGFLSFASAKSLRVRLVPPVGAPAR